MLLETNEVKETVKQENLQQLDHKAEKLRLQEEANKKVKDWAEFSLTPQTEENIRERILSDIETGENTYCMSYILTVSNLSEDFIEELILLTRPKNSKNLYKNKIDWNIVSSKQKLSEEFIERHEKEVNWDLIYYFQDLSDEFKKKYIYKLSVNNRPIYDI